MSQAQERWFRKPSERGTSHVPFRDKASQHFLKPTYRRGKEKEEVPEEQEPESEPPQLLPSSDEGEQDEQDEDDEEDAWVPDLPQDTPQRPSVEEYQKRWDVLKNWHARGVPGDFCRDNLVPSPEPQLWNDCPYVPFDELKSSEAQSRLSVCRPHSGLEEASCATGVPRYAHNTGSVVFRRWASSQVANTMAVVVC